MIKPVLSIKLAGNRRTYSPGETLRGSAHLYGLRAADVLALEISVLWHTEGKGDEDLDVHHFQRLSYDSDQLCRTQEPVLFETKLPASPLSYNGVLVKIRWLVRLRVFLPGGKELAEDEVFRLGNVPVRAEVGV